MIDKIEKINKGKSSKLIIEETLEIDINIRTIKLIIFIY